MRRSTARSVRPARAALLAIAALSAALAPSLEAQEPPERPVSTASARWTGWARGLLVLGGLVSLDRRIRDGTRDLQSGMGDDVASFGRWFGDWQRSAPLVAAGALVVGALPDGSDAARRGASIVLGVLAGSMANEALNVAVGRGRPSEDAGPWRFDPFDGHASFPSGHTAYAFAIAGAIDEATDGPAPALVAYTTAGLTGLSRIYDDRHWLSDVAIGAVVGTWVARRATDGALRLFGANRGPRDPDASKASNGALGAWLARIEPVATPRFAGIRVVH